MGWFSGKDAGDDDAPRGPSRRRGRPPRDIEDDAPLERPTARPQRGGRDGRPSPSRDTRPIGDDRDDRDGGGDEPVPRRRGQPPTRGVGDSDDDVAGPVAIPERGPARRGRRPERDEDPDDREARDDTDREDDAPPIGRRAARDRRRADEDDDPIWTPDPRVRRAAEARRSFVWRVVFLLVGVGLGVLVGWLVWGRGGAPTGAGGGAAPSTASP